MLCTTPLSPRHRRCFKGLSSFPRCFWSSPFTGYRSAAAEDITATTATTIQLWDSHGELDFFCFCFCFLGVLPFCCFYFISSFLLIEFSLLLFVSYLILRKSLLLRKSLFFFFSENTILVPILSSLFNISLYIFKNIKFSPSKFIFIEIG